MMKLIHNQSHLAVKWVILRSLWSWNWGFGRDCSEELSLLVSVQEGGSSSGELFISAGDLTFKKTLGKKRGKK